MRIYICCVCPQSHTYGWVMAKRVGEEVEEVRGQVIGKILLWILKTPRLYRDSAGEKNINTGSKSLKISQESGDSYSKVILTLCSKTSSCNQFLPFPSPDSAPGSFSPTSTFQSASVALATRLWLGSGFLIHTLQTCSSVRIAVHYEGQPLFTEPFHVL